MKYFLTFWFLFFCITTSKSLQAQCTGVSEADSLELVKFYEALDGDDWEENNGWLIEPVKNWYGVVTTSDGCNVLKINLGFNFIEGEIPDLNLPKLERLYLRANLINGIASNLENLPNLKELNLESNRLTGFIPNLNLPNLTTLNLRINDLTGSIPDFNLSNLEDINLDFNDLTGSIPNFNLPNLKELNIRYNDLTGSIPDFTNVPKLELLVISENQLSGSIPDFSNITALKIINLQENTLDGSVPNFENLQNLNELNLSRNKLVGIVPDFSNLPDLTTLDLSENQLTGIIPDFSNLSKLEELDLSDNQLSGPVLDFTNTPSLLTLDLYSNSLSGNIPDFENLPKLERMRLFRNQLTGTVPDFSNVPDLLVLNLFSNKLSGNLFEFSNVFKLNILSLGNNEIEGELIDYSNLPELTSLYLNGNQLTGDLIDFSNLPNLSILSLSENKISGPIPNFSNSPELSMIILRNNKLEGPLPNFSNLSKLWLFIASYNRLTGNIPNYDLPELKEIEVKNNQMSGSIPNFDKLPSLEVLEVCPNNFDKPIPTLENCPNLLFFDTFCIEGPPVTGIVFNDKNDNCIQEVGEELLPNTKITVNDSLYYTFTDENGFYKIHLDTGVYQIAAHVPSFLWEQNCPNNPSFYDVTLDSYTDSIPNKDFSLNVVEECALLAVNIGTPPLQQCSYNTYTVQYYNQGTTVANDAVIELIFPPDIVPESASIPHSPNGSVWSFNVGTLEIGACGTFTVEYYVNCTALVGSAACVEAHIFPSNLCTTISPLWDGSDLILEGECIDDEFIQFTITNVGSSMQDSTEFRIYEDDILSALDKLKLFNGESEELSIEATGETYRLVIEQSDFYPFESSTQVVVELCGEEPYSLGYVTSQSSSDLETFIDIDCQQISESYNPDNMGVNPTGIYDANYIDENTILNYKISFQNIKHDTVFHVEIIDTLPSNLLDIQTFEILSASHSYEAQISNHNILVVKFNNILLPDSSVNQIESKGFFQYSIQPLANASKGLIISNRAYISYDSPGFMETDTVFHTLGIPLADVPLPIELLQFHAYLDESQNGQLTWITASEINNSHFEVQRSIDGRHFAAIGKLTGKGTTSELHSYQFEDSDLPTTTSMVYYRLKQIDFNGQYSYSKVISLQLENERTTKIWYNTAQNKIEVIAVQSLQLQVFDATGRLVKSVEVFEGRQTIEVNDLASGMYAYQLLQSGVLKVGQTGKLLVVGD